jgi:hypothetical protein
LSLLEPTELGLAMNKPTDWRLTNQEKYLMGVTLVRRQYRRYPKNPEWDHDHCEFCGATFMVEDAGDVLHEGYSTLDDYRWICDQCFQDFKERFVWRVVEDSDAEGG